MPVLHVDSYQETVSLHTKLAGNAVQHSSQVS